LKFKFLGMILLMLLPVLISGCAPEPTKTLKIAQQYGLAYAPLQIAEELQLIEKHLPGYRIEWVRMINTAGIREAMVSGDLDIGFMGIPPFLIGVDRGMEWKIFRALARTPVGLAYDTARITSLEDIGPNHKIALPQPGSIQHILLNMYIADRYPQGLDLENYLTTLSHPDGQMALESDTEIAAHFTSPPYLFEELSKDSIELMIDGEEAFGGPFTFIVGVVRGNFKDAEVIEGVNRAIEEAAELIQRHPGRAVEILAPVYELPESVLREYLEKEGMDFSSEVLGTQRFSDFMFDSGLLSGAISQEDVFYEKE